MGRRKLNMELIEKEQFRLATYEKGKKGLKEKASEFSILCRVDTCMIIYGPKLNGQSPQTEIWPEDPGEVRRIIHNYKAKASTVPGIRTYNLFDFFHRRKKQVDDELDKLRKANMEAKFLTMGVRLNKLSLDQIKGFLRMIDAKLEAAVKRIVMIKENQVMMRNSNTWERIDPSNLAQVLSQKKMALGFVRNLQPESSLRHADMQTHQYCSPPDEAPQLPPYHLEVEKRRLMMAEGIHSGSSSLMGGSDVQSSSSNHAQLLSEIEFVNSLQGQFSWKPSDMQAIGFVNSLQGQFSWKPSDMQAPQCSLPDQALQMPPYHPEVVKRMLMVDKENQRSMHDCNPWLMDGSNIAQSPSIPTQFLHETYTQVEYGNNLQPYQSPMKQMCLYHNQLSDQMLPDELNVLDDHTMNISSFTQLGCPPSFSNTPCTSPDIPVSYDPASTMLDNVMLGPQICYNVDPPMPSMPTYGQGTSMTPSVFPRVHGSQYNNVYHEIDP